MNSGVPLISIITPLYNASQLIEEFVQKVQLQSFKDFELVLIEGNSQDNTIEKARILANKYNNITLYSGKDNGVYDAMNKGLEFAKGEWLYFLGCDDYFFETGTLLKMSKVLTKTNSKIVYGNAWVERYGRIFDGIFDTEKILRHNICHQAVFYHRLVFEKIGNYNLVYKKEADYVFNLKCWLCFEFQPLYIPVTVAFFAHGGISSFERDSEVIKDYPSITMDAIIASKLSFFKKIDVLSVLLLKIASRYKIKSLFILALYIKSHFFLLASSFIWMFMTLPVRILKNKILKS